MTDSDFIEFLLAASVLRTETDQLMSRSGAPLAPLHPKCPFQVRLQRFRT